MRPYAPSPQPLFIKFQKFFTPNYNRSSMNERRRNPPSGKPTPLSKLNADLKTAGSAKTEKDLTPKQRMFIKFVGEGDSQTNAAIRAGATPSSARTVANQWRKHPIINQLIMEEHKKYEITAHMTKTRVMEMQLEAFDMAKLAAEPATMVAAARELGKLCGYYEPVKYQVDVSVNGQVVMERLNTLSDAELLKMIAEGAPKGSVAALGAPN